MSALAAGMILAQLAAVAPPAGGAPVVTVSDRTELRARTRLTTSGVAEDLENTPSATLAARGRRMDASLGYALHLGYIDFAEQGLFIVSNAGQLSLGYLATRELRLSLAADGYIGKQFAETLVAPTTFGTSPLPTTTAFAPPVPEIYSAAYRAALGFNYRLDARWELGASVLYGAGQGLNPDSRLIIPRYYGPSGTVTLGYEATKVDRFATAVRAAYTQTPKTGADYFDTAAYETWTHTFSPRTSGVVGAGLSWQRSHDRAGATANSAFFPDAQVGVNHRVPLGLGETLSFEAIGRLGFAYDAVLRTSSPTASAGAGVGWARTVVGAGARLDYLTTIPTNQTQYQASQIAGSVMLWYTPARSVRLEAGWRAYKQELPGNLPVGPAATVATTPQLNNLNWAAFVAVVLTAPPFLL